MKNRYEIQLIKPVDYVKVAKTYAEVFSGEPWREVSRCNRCNRFSSQNPNSGGICNCGGSFSFEAYPLEDTTKYISGELAKTDAVGLFLNQVKLLETTQQEAMGFGWGFKMTSKEFSQKKYRTEEMQQTIIDLLVKAGFFYYVSEVGVLPDLQGFGYGKKITREVIEFGQKKGYGQFVVRTNEDSPMRYILEKMGMKPIVGLQTGIKDTENESRVLFLAKR